MSQAVDTAVLYSAVLRPHRSVGISGIRIVSVIVAVWFAILGIVFTIAGAWPVAPFLGVEVVLLYAALRINLRAGNASETIALTRRALIVHRIDHWGKQTDFSFPPQWLQVNLLEMPGDDNRLELRAHGRSLAIASFLMPQERSELAETLRCVLNRMTLAGPAGSGR
jgi:Integral membrane protein